MITYKTPQQVASMQKAGKILHQVLKEAVAHVSIGMTTAELDAFIDERITTLGGFPGFKKVPNYKWASCICVNEVIVHAPPSKQIIADGDVVTIDTGVMIDGLHTDSAYTVQVGRQDKEVARFLETGKKTLEKALAQVKAGNRIGHISAVIEKGLQTAGYSIVEELTGHGVGKELHEDPYIPCYVDKPLGNTPLIKPGMTLAIEIMYSMGKPQIHFEEDDWTISMADNSISACFEHSVAVQENTTLILT